MVDDDRPQTRASSDVRISMDEKLVIETENGRCVVDEHGRVTSE
ncbi:MAG: hypothetical protein ACXVHB_17375 [Solirubrobacteraceae bacterium]